MSQRQSGKYLSKRLGPAEPLPLPLPTGGSSAALLYLLLNIREACAVKASHLPRADVRSSKGGTAPCIASVSAYDAALHGSLKLPAYLGTE